MSRKFWVVFSPDLGYLEADGRRVIPDDRVMHNFGIFFREDSARAFAQQVAIRNPAIEVQIAESLKGFFAPPPKTITEKVWTPNGEYIPL